jgi:chemotaxis protein MotB
MNASTTRTSGIAVLGFLLLTSGCVSQKTLKDYQDEVRSLREERTQLKKENRQLRMQNDSYEVALAEASTQLIDEPTSPEYDELDALGIDYRNQGGNFVISIPSSITFSSGKATLTKQGKGALSVVARTLSRDYGDGVFWIEGHTDSDPIRKSKWKSNRDLSVARAMEVLHFLVEDAAIVDDQCVVAGHGQYAPQAANDDDAGKARNRRVEIVVHRPQA